MLKELELKINGLMSDAGYEGAAKGVAIGIDGKLYLGTSSSDAGDFWVSVMEPTEENIADLKDTIDKYEGEEKDGSIEEVLDGHFEDLFSFSCWG